MFYAHKKLQQCTNNPSQESYFLQERNFCKRSLIKHNRVILSGKRRDNRDSRSATTHLAPVISTSCHQPSHDYIVLRKTTMSKMIDSDSAFYIKPEVFKELLKTTFSSKVNMHRAKKKVHNFMSDVNVITLYEIMLSTTQD